MHVMVLLGVARHPVTGRFHRADLDARALELGLRATGVEVSAVHAGLADRTALEGYLGMGVGTMTVLETQAGRDPCGVLEQHLQGRQPDLVLCGERAETGEGSGCLPYTLARALDMPIVSGISDVELTASTARVQQVLPRGRRRVLETSLPALATVGAAGPRPRQNAFGRARAGHLEIIRYPETEPSVGAVAWQLRPARSMPKRLHASLAALSGEERLKALTEGVRRGGEVLKDLSPDAAAERLLEYLARAGVLP
jgi:electron transfer flavoprotein beta subunit